MSTPDDRSILHSKSNAGDISCAHTVAAAVVIVESK